ncbi:hypothetical protein BDD12DRAFT_1823 [Trichophaea hybrida]|nr:hypothetical protein BDD12DRAFT_1823 [Trichophaea hybrida]
MAKLRTCYPSSPLETTPSADSPGHPMHGYPLWAPRTSPHIASPSPSPVRIFPTRQIFTHVKLPPSFQSLATPQQPGSSGPTVHPAKSTRSSTAAITSPSPTTRRINSQKLKSKN